jgi:hypothetical protein
MKVRFLLFSLALILMIVAACSDDDPVKPKSSGPAPFNVSQLPVTLPNTTYGFGNMALDGSGNLLIPSQLGTIYRINKNNGNLEIAAANVSITDGGPYTLICCVYDAATDMIYAAAEVSNPSRIWRVDPSDGSSELLTDLGDQGYICQLLMAPAGYGAYGGWLLVFTNSGSGTDILAVNPANPGSVSSIAPLRCNSAAFGPDGTLYALDYGSAPDRVVTVGSDGTVAEYLPNQDGIEGIVVNNANNRMYICRTGLAGVDSLYSVTMPGKVVTGLLSPDLDDGWYPTGLILSGSRLLFNGGESFKYIDYHEL